MSAAPGAGATIKCEVAAAVYAVIHRGQDTGQAESGG